MKLTLAMMCGGRDHVLDRFEVNPTWTRLRIKSVEAAAAIMVDVAKQTCLAEASAMILPVIQDWFTKYVATNGPKQGPSTQYGDWEEGHDDGLLNLFEPYAETLSGSWLGFATTDVRLWNEGEDEKLANSFAAEVWLQLTFKRSDNQILAGVGIVSSDLAVYGRVPDQLETPKREFSQMLVNAIINKIMLTMPDPAQLEEDLDFASDTDDALSAGAAERLGISMEDVETLREARIASGAALEAWANAINAGELLDEQVAYVDIDPRPANVSSTYDALQASLAMDADLGPELPPSLVRKPLPPLPPGSTPIIEGGAVVGVSLPPGLPPPPSATKPALPPLPPGSVPVGATAGGVGAAPPVNTGKGGRRTKTPEAPPAGYIPMETLRSIKEHSGIKDEDMADLLGISRPTLGNLMKGKGWYVPPDAARREAIKNRLTVYVNALSEAYNVL